MRDLVVQTTSGAVRGRSVADGVVRFAGIPFAAPPVGERRLQPPEPPRPWTGVLEASGFGPRAAQNPSATEAVMGGGPAHPMSEDCLTLNVWTPGLDGDRRPVMVWIHGGAFATGSGGVPWYHGTRLVERGDVVVVTINYRLGAFGFLHLAELYGERFPDSGNLGLLDQIAALEWVRGNIAGFGGDPGRVTVFGESAGGMSVGTLLGAPAATGLFHGAIAQSGAGDNVSPPERATRVAVAVLGVLGIDATDPAGWRVLLDAPVDAMLAAQHQVSLTLLGAAFSRQVTPEEAGALPFQPVIDGTTVPVHPVESVAAGSAATVPLVIGTTADEWRLFQLMSRLTVDEDRLRTTAAWLFGADRAGAVLDTYRGERTGATPEDVWVALSTDWAFRIPAIRLAEAHAKTAVIPSTYTYEFGYRSTAFGGALGASHAIDVPFVFDNLDRAGVDLFLGPIDSDARRLAAVTSGAWLAFAHDGRPAADGLPEWPPYTAERRATMLLVRGRLGEVVDDPRGAERQLWDRGG